MTTADLSWDGGARAPARRVHGCPGPPKGWPSVTGCPPLGPNVERSTRGQPSSSARPKPALLARSRLNAFKPERAACSSIKDQRWSADPLARRVVCVPCVAWSLDRRKSGRRKWLGRTRTQLQGPADDGVGANRRGVSTDEQRSIWPARFSLNLSRESCSQAPAGGPMQAHGPQGVPGLRLEPRGVSWTRHGALDRGALEEAKEEGAPSPAAPNARRRLLPSPLVLLARVNGPQKCANE